MSLAWVDTKGTVYLPKESCLQPWLGISEDEGRTWRNVKVSPKSAGDALLDPSVDVDAKGNIYYTWVGGDRRIYLAVSKDGGDTWTKAMDIRSPGVREVDLPSIDVSKPGHVAISYLGSENSPWKPNCKNCTTDKYAKTTWNGYVTVTKNALAKKPLFLSTSVNSKADPFFRRRCGPGRCQNAFDFVDVVIANDGTVYTPWVDGCYGACIESETLPSSGNAGVVARLDGFRL